MRASAAVRFPDSMRLARGGVCERTGIAVSINRMATLARTPLLSRGGVAARSIRSREATFEHADGVVLARIPDQQHPVRSNKVAARLFLDVAATPITCFTNLPPTLPE